LSVFKGQEKSQKQERRHRRKMKNREGLKKKKKEEKRKKRKKKLKIILLSQLWLYPYRVTLRGQEMELLTSMTKKNINLKLKLNKKKNSLLHQKENKQESCRKTRYLSTYIY